VQEVVHIAWFVHQQKVGPGGWRGFDRIPGEDAAVAQLLVDQAVFFDREDVGTYIGEVALGVDKDRAH